ncbi:MAG: dicarboxylate/amino acid:cation symporter [Caulobacterales bacterium]|nr:dicarboxylate/amino acid:cation symporter [Caulobacterales bacterium]
MTDTPAPGAPVGLFARYKSMSLGVKILVWMAIGVVAGYFMGERALIFDPVGQLFINLLLMAAIPLVFFNLLAGLTSLADISVLGKLGIRTLFYYVGTTAVALAVGLFFATWFQPGRGAVLSEEAPESFGEVPVMSDLIIGLFPKNVFESFATGNVTQIVVFAIFLGIATLLMPKEQKEAIQNGFALAAGVLRQLITFVLAFAPIGVAALAAVTVGKYGSAVFQDMAKFLGTVWAAQAVMVLVYMTLLAVFARRNPFTWLKSTAPLYATTAATCSSLASLVVSMDVAEKRLKLPPQIYTFTLPLGSQLNKDGTSIMLATVLLFTAQAAGVSFTLAEMVTILLVGLLLSEGSGGIPGGGLVIAMIFVEAFNLPLEVATLIAGIYRLIDMGSTTVNCMGDLVWTTILSGPQKARDP